uniref:GPI-anchored protein pfl2 isoform X2 n=1 Tax=Crassostrea virginica TaxID=6565 RepID=A0A8B8E7V1_CRAVI|nr:putative GPI-anchored protein pfl2 isoform X2 [Crassostrea virginica]
MFTCVVVTILLVPYVYGQTPGQSADPLDGFNIEALLAELGPLPGGSAPSGSSNSGNLGSAVAGISTQTGGAGGGLDLEAAIKDIQNELHQTFASDASLQGLVAGSSGDLGNLDALFGSLGGEGSSSSVTSGTNGALDVTGGSRSAKTSSKKSKSSPSKKAISPKLPPFPSQQVASQNTIEKFDRTPVEQPKDALLETSLPNIGDLSLDPPPPPKSEIPSLNSFAPLQSFTQTAGSRSTSSGSAARFQESSAFPSSFNTFGQSSSSVASQLPDLKLPELETRSSQFRQSSSLPESSFPFRTSFETGSSVASQLPDLKLPELETRSSQFRQSSSLPESSFPLTTSFETGSSQFRQSSSLPESSFPLTASFGTGSARFGQSNSLPDSSLPLTSSFETGRTSFGQGSSALAEQFKSLEQGSGTFELPQTRPPQAASSPSRRQLENLTPDELRRALAEVNREIDTLSRPIRDNSQPSSGAVTSVLPGDRRSNSLIGLQAGSIAQRFGGRTGLESAFTNTGSIGNSFDFPQIDPQATISNTGSIGNSFHFPQIDSQATNPISQTDSTSIRTDQSASQQSSGPETQQFVTAAPPQINPFSAIENPSGGLPFGQNPFLPGMQPMFGRSMFDQAPPVFGLPQQGQFFQGSGQLPPNFGQNPRVPGLRGQQPSFLNTNQLQFDSGSTPGGLRSSLPNLRFEPPNGSPVRNSLGARERDFQRGRPESASFGVDSFRGQTQSNRGDFLRESSNTLSRDRSPDRDVNRIMSSIREQRLRGNFDLGSLRRFSDRSRGGTSHLNTPTMLRLNGVTIRRQGSSGQDRRFLQHSTGRNPDMRSQIFRQG